MKTILIPTDFSETANHAAAYAMLLAARLKTDVALCEVADGLISDQLETTAHNLCSENCQGDFKPLIRTVCLTGEVVPAITELAAAERTPLIVMGASGAGRSQDLLGSNSREMIDAAKTPLLMIPAHSKLQLPKTIAFATDLHAKDIPIAYSVATFARDMGADLLIIHIDRDGYDHETRKEKFDNFCVELKKEVSYPNIQYRCIRDTEIAHGLEMLAQNGAADMLAMSHGRHVLLDDWLGGSHTHKVASKINVPLLIYPKNTGSAAMIIF